MDNNNLNNNQELQNNTNNTSTTPRYLEPEVIGELRKDKIGKPTLVAEMFILFLIVLVGLPIFTKMMNDVNSPLYKLLNKEEKRIVSSDPSNLSEFADGSKLNTLNSSTSIRFNNLIMKNFILTEKQISCVISSYNGVLDLDEGSYYLEIYANDENKKIGEIKLFGTYDYSDKNVTLTAKDINFNNKVTYRGKIVEMNDDDYPNIELNEDETGLAKITCSLTNETIIYTFKNGYLIQIDDTVSYKLSDLGNEKYIEMKKIYDNKVSILGERASVIEEDQGFIYKTNIDLENSVLPDDIDYNYYPLDTEAKKISYTLKGKGYDCK